jgi:hypothetical protein
VIRAAFGWGRIVCDAWYRGGCCAGGYRRLVKGAPAVVDAGFEVVVAAYAEAGEGDVGRGYAKLNGVLGKRGMIGSLRYHVPLCCLVRSL